MISPLKKIAVNRGNTAGKRSMINSNDVTATFKSGRLFGKSSAPLRSDQMRKMFERNVWVKACIKKISVKVAGILPIVRGFRKKDGNEKLNNRQRRQKEQIEDIFMNPNSQDESWFDFTQKRMSDILVFGHTGIELVSDIVDGSVVEVFNVTGAEIRPNINKKGLFKNPDKAYEQIQRGSVVATWPREDFIWMRNDPTASSIMPVSPLETLRQTVTAELYASQHNLDFFANNATPRLAVMFDELGTGQGAGALERAKSWWEKELRGQPHKPIFMGSEKGQVKIQTLNLSNSDMEFQAYSAWLLMKIMAVYGVQPVVLGVVLDGNQSKLNSAQQIQLFKEDAIKPQLVNFQNAWNTKVIWQAFGFRTLFLEYDNFDIWDKQEKAIWHERYLRSGVFTINQVLDELGMEPVPWGNTPLLASNLQPFGNTSEGGPPNTPGGTSEETNPDVPGTDSTGAAQEAESRSNARKSFILGLKEMGVDSTNLDDAVVNIKKRYDSFYNRVVSFPNKMVS